MSTSFVTPEGRAMIEYVRALPSEDFPSEIGSRSS